MQDPYDSRPDDSDRGRRGLTGAAGKWLGAVLSIAILGGVGVWTYRLGERDASAVPVILAMEGPAKVQPDDPGGLQAEFQGLSVNEVMRGEPPSHRPEEVTLAPAPAEPTKDDLSVSELLPEFARQPAAARGTSAAAPASRSVAAASPVQVEAAELSPDAEEEEDALSSDTTDEMTEASLPGTAPAPAPQADSDSASDEPLGSDSQFALSRSASPRQRPADLRMAAATPQQTAPEPTPVAASPAQAPAPAAVASELPKGTMMIQLGAFDSADVARSEWSRLSAQHADLLGKRQLVIQRTVSSGRVFYRLRAAGFDDLAAARATCAALTARGPACIPARQD
ncbi:SPOR domain-containing protein [Paroceanicella profunda]|uniref:SPOR domain-containing protein n=1 Tax=Paroceanicella profunda TaxID=2579971 RepID=A0A5B8FI65_9RHOB|nr:SPOR domain-containing protein [Paroceanicella profunda]QDL93381.1 SPOR domain-containing protein [Paroceanicella profunda]